MEKMPVLLSISFEARKFVDAAEFPIVNKADYSDKRDNERERHWESQCTTSKPEPLFVRTSYCSAVHKEVSNGLRDEL